MTELGTLDLTSGHDATFTGAVSATTINIASLTGSVTFDAAVTASNLNPAGGSYAILFDASTSVNGGVVFANGGGVTLGTGGTNLAFLGGLTSMVSSTALSGTVVTAGHAISIGTLTLAGAGTLDSTNGGSAAGGAITLGTVEGNNRNLTLNAGPGGNIMITGAIEGVATLDIANASDATFMGPVDALGIQIDNATGTVTFNDTLTASTLETGASGFSIALNGATSVTGAVNFANTGGVVLGSGTTVLNFTGGATATAGPVTLAGTVETAGQGVAFGALTLANDGMIDTAQSGTILLGPVTGAGHSLSLISGTGAITLADVGTGSAVNSLTVSGGQVTLGGKITSTGPVNFGAGAGETLSGHGVAIDTTGGGHAPGGAITLAAVTGGNVSLALSSGTGPIALATVGLGSPVGGLTATGGPVTLGGNISSAGAVDLSAAQSVTLNAPATIDTSSSQAGGAAISLPDLMGANGSLILNAGSAGVVTLNGTVSGLALLELANAASASFAAPVAATTVKLDNAAGTIEFMDSLAVTNLVTGAQGYALALDGATTVASAATFANSGGVSLGLGGTTLNFSAGFTHIAGPTALDGTVFTAGKPISLAGLALAGSSTLDATDNGAAPGADISIAGKIDAAAAGKQSLTLKAGTGTITLGGAVGSSVPLGALALSDATLDIGANVDITTAGGAFTQSGATVFLPPAGAGTTASVIDTTDNGAVAGARISFDSSIDGSAPGQLALTLNAGTSTVSIGGAVGGTPPTTLTAQASSTSSTPSTGALVGLPPMVGGAMPLASLSATGASITLGDAVTTVGPQNYHAASLNLNGAIYQTDGAPITVSGSAIFTLPTVILDTTNNGAAPDGANVALKTASGPMTTLAVDPGSTASLTLTGGSLLKIFVLEGQNSVLSNMVLGNATLGGSGTGDNDVIGGATGKDAANRAFILPKGKWTINASSVTLLDPALLAAGITNSTLSSQGVATAVSLMVQIQQLINRGDTGETAAQQAFDQFPNRDNYAVDPFRQRYNILGVAQEQVGGFEDISYIQDGFWEGLLKAP
jgi:mucin-19